MAKKLSFTKKAKGKKKPDRLAFNFGHNVSRKRRGGGGGS